MTDAPKSARLQAKGMELIFEVRDAEEGGYYARALGRAIFTGGDTGEELRSCTSKRARCIRDWCNCTM